MAKASLNIVIIRLSVFCTSSVLILLFCIALYMNLRVSKVGFISHLNTLLIASNLALIAYIALVTPSDIKNCSTLMSCANNLLPLAMIFDFIRYFTWLIFIWSFAFKYWVVSIEMPRTLNKILAHDPTPYRTSQQIREYSNLMHSYEKYYTIGYWTGVCLNFISVTWFITEYAIFLKNEDDPVYAQISKSITNILELISAIFLGDALRRMLRFYKG